MHPDQFVFFDDAGYGAAESPIAFLIGCPALSREIHSCRKVMEERPHGLVRISLVKCLRAPWFQIGCYVAIAIADRCQDLFSLGCIDRSIVARPADPDTAHLFENGEHCGSKSARTRFRAPVLTLVGECNRQPIAHHDESVLLGVVYANARRIFIGDDPPIGEGGHTGITSTPVTS